MKKIAVLISGQIRFFEKNLNFLKELKKNLSDFEVTIVSSVWENQDELKIFQEKYNVKFINMLKERDWTNNISKVKYVTWEENSGFKHMTCILNNDIKFYIFF